MASDEVLHVGVTQRSGNSKDTVDTVVENESSSAGNALALVLVTALVIIRQTKSLAIPAQNDACVSDIGGVKDALARGCFLEFGLSRLC